MKVPPSPGAGVDRAPTYDKDRTLTRRTVAGAGGGLKGVDYADDRRPEAHEEVARRGARPGPHEPTPGAALASAGALGASGTDKDALGVVGAERRAQEDEVRPREPERRKPKFQFKDDLTIDKDGPDRRPKRRSEKESSEDEDETSSEAVEWTDGVESGGPSVSRAHLFQETPEGPEPGDPRLFDPIAAREQLGTPASYAKHVMILGEAFRRSTGATRAEAIDYLGRMFAASGDVNFGRNALKSFGPASGILDVYPLEVVEHVLEQYPGFLPKVAFGRFFSKDGAPLRPIEARAGERIVLEYADELKVRGFALRGGGRPGYTFEPGDRPGSYHLTFASGGRFSCLVSAISRTGHTVVERLEVLVHGPRIAEPSAYPARDAARVAAWPKPARPKLAPAAVAEPTPAPRASGGATLDKGAVFALKGRELEKSVRGRASARVDVREIDESDAPIAARVEAEERDVSVARGEAARDEDAAPEAPGEPRARDGAAAVSAVSPRPRPSADTEGETQPRVRALGAPTTRGATADTRGATADTPSAATNVPSAAAPPSTSRGARASVPPSSSAARASAPPPSSGSRASVPPSSSGSRASVPPSSSGSRTSAPRTASSTGHRARPSAPPNAPREQSGSLRRAELSPALREALAAAPLVERPRGFGDAPRAAPEATSSAPPQPSSPPESSAPPARAEPASPAQPASTPPRSWPVQPESTAAASGARGDVVRGDVVRAASVDTAEIAVGPGDAPTPLAPTIDEVPCVEISATLTSPPRAPDRGPERAPFAALIEDMAVDDAAVDEGDEPTLLPDGDIVEVPAFVREIRPTRPLFDDEDEDDRADAPPPAAASTGDEHPRPRRIRSDSSIDEA